jgi:hypothetical protein
VKVSINLLKGSKRVISILFLVVSVNNSAFFKFRFQDFLQSVLHPVLKLVSPSSEGLKRVLYDHKLPFI